MVLPAGGVPFAIGHKISNNRQVVGEANLLAGVTGGLSAGWQGSIKPHQVPNSITADILAAKNGAIYGSTTALGVSDKGWIVGSAALNPTPADPTRGSEAFVLVP